MGELMSALDALAADDLHALFGPALLDRTAVLLAARNRIEAELTRTVREAEVMQAAEHDGLKTMASWLSGHGHLSRGAATRLVRDGRALQQLPAVAAAFAAGIITAEQVSVIAPVTNPGHMAAAAEQEVDLGEVDRTLAETAATRPHPQLRQVVAHYLARLDPDGPEPDPTEGRLLSIYQHDDGRVSGRFELDPVGGEKLLAGIESIVQADRPDGDTRTRAQRQADALVQLMDNQLASGNLPILRTVKPHLNITLGVQDLLDPAVGQGAARAGFGGWLSAMAARHAVCDGSFTPILLDADGQPMNMGRTRRLFPPHLRRATEVRDQGCIFAGCHAPTHWCDTHHVREWLADHGETSLENAALLCERHHTKVHHGFRIERDPQGRWHTYRPDDTEILIPLRL